MLPYAYIKNQWEISLFPTADSDDNSYFLIKFLGKYCEVGVIWSLEWVTSSICEIFFVGWARNPLHCRPIGLARAAANESAGRLFGAELCNVDRYATPQKPDWFLNCCVHILAHRPLYYHCVLSNKFNPIILAGNVSSQNMKWVYLYLIILIAFKV